MVKDKNMSVEYVLMRRGAPAGAAPEQAAELASFDSRFRSSER